MRADLISKIVKLFEDKGWELEESVQTSKFNLLCEMLKCLKSNEEVDLIINLLQNFLHINHEKYGQKIIKCLEEIILAFPDVKCFLVLPLISKADKDKIKSAHVVQYLFKGTTLKHKLPFFEQLKVKVIDSIDNIILPKGEYKILLVDDFIGTGETASLAYDYLIESNSLINKEQVIILSIVCHIGGYTKLKNNGFNVFASEFVNKGISDKYCEPYRSKFLDIMEAIEKRMKIRPDFRFGYGQSEALVCMERTPNNTFPVFWKSVKKVNVAPFPR